MFLPNLRRVNKITKSVKDINLKTKENRIKNIIDIIQKK